MLRVIEPNGNLTFIAETSDIDDLDNILDRCGGDDVRYLSDMLDTCGFLGNGLAAIYPEHIGALTDAPMLSDGVDTHDNGDVEVHGKVWFYPQYAIQHFGEVLAQKGRVTFALAH
jgi:hypothetical protein